MDTLERLAGRLAHGCNKLAALDPSAGQGEEVLAAANLVSELTGEIVAHAEQRKNFIPEAVSMPAAALTILLAEDEATDREPLREMLERMGHSVREAVSGEQALSLAARDAGRIHLLLVNVMLGDMSGRELAERLALEQPAARVIYLSGYADEEILFYGVLGPGVVTLRKPVSPEALEASLRQAAQEVNLTPTAR